LCLIAEVRMKLLILSDIHANWPALEAVVPPNLTRMPSPSAATWSITARF
jgi:hypothetical protein